MKPYIQGTRFIRTLIAAGYLLMCLLAVGIMYLWFYEWKEIEALETENRRINSFRQEVHHVYGQIAGFTLLGESVLEWEDEDLKYYHVRRMAVDSLLCSFKTIYPAGQIDSMRHCLENKERFVHGIVEVLDEQESLNQRIAERVPVIAARSAQEQPQKPKRKGFLGLFCKKKKSKPTATTSMLHSLNSKEIAQQQVQSRRLSEHADSLAMRNSELNRQLQSLIGQMDRKTESDLQKREAEITAMRERSFLQIGSLTGFLFLLLVVSYIIIHRDIHRIRRYKTKTVSLIKQLHESDKQNRELISSRKKAIHTITHELRTPLTAIHGYAELIQKYGTDGTSRYVESILQASGRMIAMLNMLLDFFRLDSGKESVNIAPFRLQGMADALLMEFIPLAEAKDLCLTVECSADIILMGDKERIMQVCGNLLSNAIKFTQSGNISLRMKYNGRVLSIVVKDTGSGMSEEEQQRVFGAFERLSNAATKDGFGLGLSIVQRIVAMLGGTVRLESEKGKGSRFTVEIPMQVAEELTKQAVQDYVRHNERYRDVIAIDNDEVLLLMLKEMYAQEGVHCDTCTDAAELMELIRRKGYSLLLTDLNMPEINGFELLELLRSSNVGNSKTVPVVVTTASGSCGKEELMGRGFAGCLFKPFSMSELMEISDRCALKGTPDEKPDFSTLLSYGNESVMLEKLIVETEKEMQAFRDAARRKDLQELDALTHHLRSSWEILRADRPLRELYRLLHGSPAPDWEVIHNAAKDVLDKGSTIIEMAKEERRKYENG